MAGDSKGLAGFAPPLRPQGRIGKRNAPVLKSGEVSAVTFALIASGDRQLAADTGGCPAPSARRPEPEPRGADTLQVVGRAARSKLGAKPTDNRPTDAGREGIAADGKPTHYIPYF